MIYRVVISHGQDGSIGKFPKEGATVFVFDAPTKAGLGKCAEYGHLCVAMPAAGHRGANRNAGLQKVLDAFAPGPDDCIEFFDGDRFPVAYRPESILQLMGKHGIACLLYTCEKDSRFEKIDVPARGATVVDTGTLCNPFYSCGFIMRVEAIYKIMAFNGGCLFEPRFTKWGSEDQYLGLVCDHLRYKVALTREVVLNGSVGGDCDAHQDYREAAQTYVDLIRERSLPLRCQARVPQVVA